MRARRGIASLSVTTVTGTYKDVADLGFTVDSWADALSGPTRSFPTAPVPGRVDSVKLSSTPTLKPGQFQLAGTVTGDTMATYLANLRAVKGWAVRAVAFKLNALDANVFVEVDQSEAPVMSIGMPVNLAARVTITFDALKPYWQSTTLTSNNLTTSYTEQALGEAPSRPVIRLTGALTNPTVSYADSSGTLVMSIGLTIALAGAGDYVEIDCQNSTVVKSVSSVVSDAAGTLSAGDFFALDPRDADMATPTYCKVKYAITAGSVSSATCTYRKHYW